MLAGLTEIVDKAADGDWAAAAFNVFGYEDAIAVAQAAEEAGSPVILAANRVAVAHMPLSYLAPILLEAARSVNVPVCVHLDHGADFEAAANAIRYGFTSVMYDGSQLPFEENVRRTREIAAMAHAFGVSVEAEIGSVGYSDPSLGMKHEYSQPEEVERFVAETGIDAVAVAVGTVHRMESREAEVDFRLLQAIQQRIAKPMVIHGATGLPDGQLLRLKAFRVGKINIGTALRMAFGGALRETMAAYPTEFDRLKLFKPAMEAVKEEAKQKIKLLGPGGA